MPTRSNPHILAVIAALLLLLCGSAFAVDRNAFTFTRYNLEVRLDPAGQAIAARGMITLRNDSNLPQATAALQISSSLEWRLIAIHGEAPQLVTQPYTSDIDHTGSVSEAVITFPAAVPPKGTIEIEVGYSGKVTQDATRLTRIGTPKLAAAASDWDQVSEAFTAVRGVGHVVWYPAAVEAANLSEGDLFARLARWRQREAGANVRVKFCWIASAEQRLTLVANGGLESVGQERIAPGDDSEAEAATTCATYSFAGLSEPSFAMGAFETLSRPAITVYHLSAGAAAAQEYALAAEKVLPFTTQWFGAPRQKLRVVELKLPGLASYDSGTVLFTPLSTDRKQVELTLAHQLTHAALSSPRPWIFEGAAEFAQALWRERQDGREAALAQLRANLPVLVQLEKQGGEPLVSTSDELMVRVKAAYVWWMLREMLSDAAVQRVLQAYRTADDREPSYLQRLLQKESKRDLEWFFDDWVYRDRGLPDFRVASAYPRALLSGGAVVTVTVENLGNAGAEVPVTVRMEQGPVSARVLVRGKGKGTVRIEVPSTPTEVVVNDGSVPESDTSNNTFAITRVETPR